MNLTESIEPALERAAAASFGACVAYSAWLVAPVAGANPLLSTLSGGALGFFSVIAGVRTFGVKSFFVPAFSAVQIAWADLDELLLIEPVAVARPDHPVGELFLTLEQRLGGTPPANDESEVLLLDDMLARIGPDSRVVRLFDPAAIPTPGELRSRIDRHLQDQQAGNFPDAAQALNDALADLRRSLR